LILNLGVGVVAGGNTWVPIYVEGEVGGCEVATIYVGSGYKVYVLAEPLLLAAFGIVSNLKFLDLYRRCEIVLPTAGLCTFGN
jgi:hypothetical protein